MKTTKNIINNDYMASISSMDELKKTQYRINKAICRSERRMRRQCMEAQTMFSYRGIIEKALYYADAIQSVCQYIGKGYYGNRYRQKDTYSAHRVHGMHRAHRMHKHDCDCY